MPHFGFRGSKDTIDDEEEGIGPGLRSAFGLLMGSGSSSGDWARSPPPNAHIIYKIGIYGWRKRCLYLFVLLLMVIVIINLALTIWILKVMDFSTDGMGKLRIVEDGVRVEGDTEFLKAFYASHIKSRSDAALTIESSRNITLHARDSDNKIRNMFFIGDQRIESYASRFEIRNNRNKLLFSADDREVYIGAEQVKVSGDEGATFAGSVQTPLVRPQASRPLRLESPTKSVYVSGTAGVFLRAPVGSITLDSLTDIKIHSKNKAIRLDAKNITMKNLLISTPQFDGLPYPEVYQLCICGKNGKLFLSPARGSCQATSSVCN